jgi:hypothetical protein
MMAGITGFIGASSHGDRVLDTHLVDYPEKLVLQVIVDQYRREIFEVINAVRKTSPRTGSYRPPADYLQGRSSMEKGLFKSPYSGDNLKFAAYRRETNGERSLP